MGCGGSSLVVPPPSDSSAIVVSGAGDQRANGIYHPSGTQNGRTVWRHADNVLLCILFDDGQWWCGHQEESTLDLYTCKDSSQWPSFQKRWEVCSGGGHMKGVPPAPTFEWRDGVTNPFVGEVLNVGTEDSQTIPIGAVVATGAGDPRANGVYLPDSAQNGRPRWRHRENTWLCILFSEGSWWCGHEQSATLDLYECESSSHQGPFHEKWKVCSGAPDMKGVPPVPSFRLHEGGVVANFEAHGQAVGARTPAVTGTVAVTGKPVTVAQPKQVH